MIRALTGKAPKPPLKSAASTRILEATAIVAAKSARGTRRLFIAGSRPGERAEIFDSEWRNEGKHVSSRPEETVVPGATIKLEDYTRGRRLPRLAVSL